MSPEISKPEWFQMADADPMPVQPKSRKRIRMMALATPLLVIGAGLDYAQTQGTSPADAGTSAQAAVNPIAISSTPATSGSSSTTKTVAGESSTTSVNAPSSSNTTTPSPTTVQVSQVTSTPSSIPTPTITKPGLTMPTGGGEDDGQEGQHNGDDGQVRTSDDD